ncbi:Aspartate aminotransferase [Planctomycetes bacterium Poly30]|uniref:Aspartate aminotransferase n=1 Tax=Saltatorellus ferox TaxID=2528018 RepID=A0A518EZQ0_9BACT|nr:Aspartate aminotransferase [Planctomycetes bacterium Poly30]
MQSPPQGALSIRGAQLASESPMAPYIVEHFARLEQSRTGAKDGSSYVPLCIAENGLLKSRVMARLHACRLPPSRVLGYDSMVGAISFREALASFMERAFLGRRFAPDQIAVLAGAGTVLENVFYALCDPGEAVLVPTPSYAGFWTDLETRNGLHIVPVHSQSDDDFRLTAASLEEAFLSADRPVKALLFTNPDNPRGSVATRQEIEEILRWADGRQIHVVFDEIYALSVFGEAHFTSAAAIRPALGDRVHIVWAFSKDFGASGLRCGVLVSENEALLAAVNGLAYWGAVSGHTQWLLEQMIADDPWIEHYCADLRLALRSAYESVATALDAAGIPFVPAQAGIFVLCDMRGFLTEPTWDAEAALWRRILEECNVNLTPGSACRIAEPGFMRLCYAAEPLDSVVTAIGRVGDLFG